MAELWSRIKQGTSLCSSITKVIDIVMLMRYSHLLNTIAIAVCLKKGHNTVMSTLDLKEVINYYLNNNSEVCTRFIYATKVFDCKRYGTLFQILLDIGMPAVRSMLGLTKDKQSELFGRVTCVEALALVMEYARGDNLNYFVFNVHGCVAEMIRSWWSWLSDRQAQLWGTQLYADDLTLDMSCISGLRKICEKYGEEFSVDYNPTKMQAES